MIKEYEPQLKAEPMQVYSVRLPSVLYREAKLYRIDIAKLIRQSIYLAVKQMRKTK